MFKAKPFFHHEVAYIRLSKLPFGQAGRLTKWLPAGSTFRVQTRDEVYDDCVAYSDYLFWYEQNNSRDENLIFSI